jgi:hypothetical protein
VTYRRDISSTLRLLFLALILFLGYHLWFKPNFLATIPPLENQSTAEQSLPPAPLILSEDPPSQLWDMPASRLVDLGSAPNRTLDLIRDKLDLGKYNEVERELKALSQKTLTQPAIRRYVAGLWNNLGIQQEKYGGTRLSLHAYKKAVGLDPRSSIAHLNLAQAYWELRDPALTQKFLETVIRLAPQDPFSHLALADLLLDQGHVAQAAAHLKQAESQTAQDVNQQSYLQTLIAKVHAAESAPFMTTETTSTPRSIPAKSVQSTVAPSHIQSPLLSASVKPASPAEDPTLQTPPRQLRSRDASYFIVQYDGPPDEAIWIRMRAILEYACTDLSHKFGHVPAKSIAVVLHTGLKFDGASGSPRWADTLFDESSGTIHIPTQHALDDLALFSRIVRHEFAHALLLDYMKGAGATVPRWLIEGLAMQLAEDPWPDLEEVTPQVDARLPLTSLEKAWTHLRTETLVVAYRESHSATKTLIDRYSVYSIRQVVNLLRTGHTLDAAMRNKLSLSYEQFQREWALSGAASGREG